MGRSEAQLDQAQHDSAYLRGIRYPRTTEGAKPEGDQISTEGARPEGDQVPTEGARPEMGAGAETSTEGAEPERGPEGATNSESSTVASTLCKSRTDEPAA